MSARRRDHYAGALVALTGGAVAWRGSLYGLDPLIRPGPELFAPELFAIVIGIGMVVLGVLIAAGADIDAEGLTRGSSTAPERRGWVCILSAVLLFVGLARYAGLLPSAFACVLLAALGDRQTRLWHATCLAGGISVLGVLLFSVAWQAPIPLLGPM